MLDFKLLIQGDFGQFEFAALYPGVNDAGGRGEQDNNCLPNSYFSPSPPIGGGLTPSLWQSNEETLDYFLLSVFCV